MGCETIYFVVILHGDHGGTYRVVVAFSIISRLWSTYHTGMYSTPISASYTVVEPHLLQSTLSLKLWKGGKRKRKKKKEKIKESPCDFENWFD